ncbi:MAG TPA: hypothetical protein VGI81_27245 [Tepidisphaeraceae bacterium]|jgi:hypothetical protein
MARGLINPFRTSQVKVMRRRVMQQDLDLFAAIAGRKPELPPDEEPVEQAVKVATAAKAKPWSAAVLAGYLNNFRVPRVANRVVSPEVADWVRKLSNHALGRLQEAQDRLTAARGSARMRQERSEQESRAA